MKKVIADISGVIILLLGVFLIIWPIIRLFTTSTKDYYGCNNHPVIFYFSVVSFEILGILLLRSGLRRFRNS